MEKKELTKRQKAMLKTRRQKVTSCLKSADLYGERIQLTYKGESAYKTLFGAFLTLTLVSLVGSQAVLRFQIMVNRQDTTVTKATTQRDLNDTQIFFPGLNGFDFALGFSFGSLDPSIGFITMNQVYQDNGVGDIPTTYERVPLDFSLCGSEYFNFNDTQAQKYYQIPSFYCLHQKNFSLKGDFRTQTMEYVEVNLHKCNGTECKSDVEIAAFFEKSRVYFAFINSYFAYDNYDDPIQYFIDDQFFWNIELSKSKRAHLFVQWNKVELQDGLFEIFPDQFEFVHVDRIREFDLDYKEGYALATINIRVDKEYDIYERQVQTFLQFLGDIGGLAEALSFITMIMVSTFSNRMFIAALLKKSYQVIKKTKETIDKSQSQKKESQESYTVVKTELPLNNQSQRDQSWLIGSNRVQPSQILEQSEAVIPTSPGKNILQNALDKGFQLATKESNNEIKEQQKLSMNLQDIKGLIHIIMSRERFKYGLQQIFEYLGKCLCCFGSVRLKKKNKLHYLYRKGQDKLLGELDVITLVKQIRNMKLISNTLLSQKQRILLRFQRKLLLETESSGSSDSDNNKYDTVKLVDHKNPLVQLHALGKINKALKTYNGQRLSKTDQRLIHGLSIKRLKDNPNQNSHIPPVVNQEIALEKGINEENYNQKLLMKSKTTVLNSSQSIQDQKKLNINSQQDSMYNDEVKKCRPEQWSQKQHKEESLQGSMKEEHNDKGKIIVSDSKFEKINWSNEQQKEL